MIKKIKMDKDPLWHLMNSSKYLKREELELVIQKKKVNELLQWFQEHFVTAPRAEYLAKCPIIIIQGPTGSGKTSTLRWISNELKIPLKEYSETTDTTAIGYDLARAFSEQEERSIEKRKAIKFEHFVINSIRYNTLYPPNELASDDADEEFDSDDLGLMELISGKPKPPQRDGVIIHVESTLTFSRSQRILIQTLSKLLKLIREISKNLTRRIAIVFETLEGENELSLPNKFKQLYKVQIFKFNPIIRANMKKLVESILNNYGYITVDKETVDQLLDDCDGDIRACLNTLQLIINRPDIHVSNNKRQKLSQIRLNPSLMRDTTRSLNFFHVLGKIFYQKRLYPELEFTKRVRTIDRPYPRENSTEYLMGQLDTEPRNLLCWLHQHYHKFCSNMNIEKAFSFLDNLTTVDTISLSSIQSNQFYESHHHIDQLQTYVALESTTFSLYHDQSNMINKSGPRRKGQKVVKSSVESSTSSNELYSFKKPVLMNLTKVTEAQYALLDAYATYLMKNSSTRPDPGKVLIDYLPFIKHFSKYNMDAEVIRALENLEIPKQEVDYEDRYDKLLELTEMFS